MSDETDDRRRAERIPINEEFGRLPEATYISDLSELGVFVHTRSAAPLGALINLRFTVLLADPIVIEAQGRVVRHTREPRGMGVEFTILSPETMLKLNDVLTKQQPRESGPPVTPDDSLDGQQTTTKGQIPIRAADLKVRHAGSRDDSDSDDGNTSRYPAVDSSSSGSDARILGSGEYELVDEDGEDP